MQPDFDIKPFILQFKGSFFEVSGPTDEERNSVQQEVQFPRNKFIERNCAKMNPINHLHSIVLYFTAKPRCPQVTVVQMPEDWRPMRKCPYHHCLREVKQAPTRLVHPLSTMIDRLRRDSRAAIPDTNMDDDDDDDDDAGSESEASEGEDDWGVEFPDPVPWAGTQVRPNNGSQFSKDALARVWMNSV
ncbi:hypothetical protein RQP46_008515 [Phenoliferia psychrophenolica]